METVHPSPVTGSAKRRGLRYMPGGLAAVALLIPLMFDSALSQPAAGRLAQEHGTTAVAHRAGGIPAVYSGSRPRALVSRTGFEAGEPTLGLTRDGVVFFASFHEPLRVEVLRSDDEGRSWKVVSPQFSDEVNSHLVSLDPYLYVDDATGRVFTIDLTVACSYLSFSDNGGRSWTTNPLACGRPINDHQSLFAGPPVTSITAGYPRVVYYCFGDALATSSCSKSLDGGVSFAPTGTPAFFFNHDPPGGGGRLFCGGLHGHGVVGSDGTIYLPKDHCGRPLLAISKDEGATWTRVRVSRMPVADSIRNASDPSVAVDSDGNLYYAWVGRDRLPYLSVSKDDGRRWTRPVMIGAPGVRQVNLLTIDVGRPGSVAFSYMGTKDSKHPRRWGGYVGMTTQFLKPNPLFLTAAVNRVANPLKRGLCGPGRCGAEVLDFLDVVIGPDGTPWASFVDACDPRCEEGGPERGNEGLVGRLIGGPILK